MARHHQNLSGQLSSSDAQLDATLQRFWEIETIPKQFVHSASEKICEAFCVKTTSIDPSGRYIVRLPRTENPQIELGESELIAERRFLALERRLERNLNIKFAYHQFMDDYERLGHMRRLDEPVDNTKLHCYLPHHPVFKLSSTTTKTRVVFDASCQTTSGSTPNDILLVGPVVQDDFLSLVIRFCFHRIALNRNIEKMYRLVLLHEEDQPLQRIKLRSNPSDPITTYQLPTVTY
ncbi:uncharacterized protein LOC134203280, partial [Armigeres subalbatus]|uniref:uncharacterized protein LOC134203280 n=1 Tax=Armigeres subalbatus TaxID=124917 RepID=UPI002ED58F06